MQIYNPNAKCPKCGNNHITTSYWQKADLMKRCCMKCNHQWAEKPLDAVPFKLPPDPEELREQYSNA